MLTLDPDVFYCLDVQKCSWREVEPRDKVVVAPPTKKVQSSTGCHKIVVKVVVVAQSYNGGHKVVVWRFLEHCDNK